MSILALRLSFPYSASGSPPGGLQVGTSATPRRASLQPKGAMDMTMRHTLASDLCTLRELKAGCDTTAPRIGRHRAEADGPGAGSQTPAWNNSTTVIQTIRDAW